MNTKMRIKKSTDFNLIIQNGKKLVNNYFIIYYKDSKNDDCRFGVTCVKKFGKAYKRNRYKRITREIIRNNLNNFKKGNDYIIIIRKSCDTLNYNSLVDKLLILL